MANTLVQFRVEEDTRAQAASICERLGIDLPTAMRMFVVRMVQENGIPFSMKLEDRGRTAALAAMREASRLAEQYGIADMSLKEINAEIDAVREKRA